MEEKQNWLTIAAVVLVVAGLGIFLYRQSQQQPDEILPENSEEQVAEDRANKLIDDLNFEIPDDAERVNLKDVSGGDSAGVATRRENADGSMTQSVLVALPEPEAGEFYEAYLVSSNEEESPLFLGKLRSVKGGWMLDYTLSEDEVSNSTIRITRETADDKQPEETVLEGEFSTENSEEMTEESAPEEAEASEE